MGRKKVTKETRVSFVFNQKFSELCKSSENLLSLSKRLFRQAEAEPKGSAFYDYGKANTGFYIVGLKEPLSRGLSEKQDARYRFSPYWYSV